MDSRRSGKVWVDPGLPPVEIPSPVLNEMYNHALKAYPMEECCGLLVGDDELPFREAHACRNDMTKHHRRDPFNYPRAARSAFHMRETDYLRVLRDAERRRLRVTAVYHSHVDAEPYFSELDQEFASQPLFPFPGALHLVISVTSDQGPALVHGVGAFRWQPEQGHFEGRPLRAREP